MKLNERADFLSLVALLVWVSLGLVAAAFDL